MSTVYFIYLFIFKGIYSVEVDLGPVAGENLTAESCDVEYRLLGTSSVDVTRYPPRICESKHEQHAAPGRVNINDKFQHVPSAGKETGNQCVHTCVAIRV